jgi:integrase
MRRAAEMAGGVDRLSVEYLFLCILAVDGHFVFRKLRSVRIDCTHVIGAVHRYRFGTRFNAAPHSGFIHNPLPGPVLPEPVWRSHSREVISLKAHRIRQLQERLLAGTRWQDTGFVFTTTIGTPLDARNVQDGFKTLLDKAELRSQRFHDLRHGAASLLLAQGVHPRSVMEILGHSQIGITLNLYSHVMPELLRDAAQKIDAILAGK